MHGTTSVQLRRLRYRLAPMGCATPGITPSTRAIPRVVIALLAAAWMLLTRLPGIAGVCP